MKASVTFPSRSKWKTWMARPEYTRSPRRMTWSTITTPCSSSARIAWTSVWNLSVSSGIRENMAKISSGPWYSPTKGLLP
jgi:hypothetical protein